MTINLFHDAYGRVVAHILAVVAFILGLLLLAMSLNLAVDPDHTSHEPAPQRTAIATWHTGHDDGLKVDLDIYGFSGSSIDASLTFSNEGKTSLSITAVRLYVGEAGTTWDDLSRFDIPMFGQLLMAGEHTTFAFTGTATGTGSRLVVQVLFRGLDIESGIDHEQQLWFEVIVPVPEIQS